MGNFLSITDTKALSLVMDIFLEGGVHVMLVFFFLVLFSLGQKARKLSGVKKKTPVDAVLNIGS
jgi:hypothetical protein